jgi:phospholipid/cholesterol/gamma-HCH transport system permease protein
MQAALITAALPAAISQPKPGQIILSGSWTARFLGPLAHQLNQLHAPSGTKLSADGTQVQAMDTAGAWVLQKLISRFTVEGAAVTLQGLPQKFSRILEAVAPPSSSKRSSDKAQTKAASAKSAPGWLARVGRPTADMVAQALAFLSFIGESVLALWLCVRHPARLRWRPMLFNLRTAGVDALPIVGLLSFLLGVVVAYQGAAQLRLYGANIFVADLVGLSMLREFAPLIAAIIIAGRSGSAYTAQIGTMAVTEEIDALRTIGIEPLELLVLPKVIALMVALPLLTVFADGLGVAGGMIMARAQLDVSFNEFLDRFVLAVSPTAFLVGICKAPVFAAIIAIVGCYQGFQTKGGADSVGRQTTRSVVQSIFLVIVADAAFSVAFSALDL